MRTHKTIAEILNDLATVVLARQAKVELEPLEDEHIELGDLLPVQYRSKPWLED
jgi:hypothetical protein